MLRRLPAWDAYRSLAGAVGAGWLDTIDLDHASLVPGTLAVFDCGGFSTALVYWTATAENRVTHTLTFEPLIWDGDNSRWVAQPTFALHPREVGEFPVYGCATVALRVHAQAAPGTSDADILVTGGAKHITG